MVYFCSSCPIDQLGNCDSCVSGYYAVDNVCKACQGGCKKCTNSGNCFECLTGYTLYGNQYCGNCGVDYCAECSGDSSLIKTCTKCFDTTSHFLFNGECLKLQSFFNGVATYGTEVFACPVNCDVCLFIEKEIVCYKCI